jgi:hypothetical protein
MDENKRRARIIEDREKRAAAALGLDHANYSAGLEDELTNFLIDVLHLADQKRLHLDLQKLATRAQELHEKEKMPRGSGGGSSELRL